MAVSRLDMSRIVKVHDPTASSDIQAMLADSKLDDVRVFPLNGVFVPVGTPPDITNRLNSVINAAVNDEKIRKTFTDQAQEPAGGTAEQYARLVREDSEKFARLVKELNVTVE